MTSPRALVGVEPATRHAFAVKRTTASAARSWVAASAPAVTLQRRVLDALARHTNPTTTTELLSGLNHPGGGPAVVIERVYVVLVALERKGQVQRGTNLVGTRPTWGLRTPSPTIDTTRSHTMHCTVSAPKHQSTHVVLSVQALEERIAQIETPAQARALAEVILTPWETGTWQRWKPLASAPLAAWLYTARRVDAGNQVDWILRALAHRPQWSRAASRMAHDPQLRESLRSVSRLDDHRFADIGWMLVLALFPWSPCVSATVPTPAGDR